ncbi:MAG: zinc ribbon domain-containing protein [Acidimicrobiia bacterium]
MNEMQSYGDLLDLQDVDLEIDRLIHTRSTLPVLDTYKTAHAASIQAKNVLGDLEEQFKLASRDLDKAEGELELLEDKLQREEQRLFAGGMSARETENMRNEVISLRAKQSEMETLVLEVIDRREGIEELLGAAQREADQTAVVEQELEAEVAAEWRKIDAQLARREGRKVEIIPLIPPDLLGMYDKLRVSKEGVAIGRLIDGVCGGCHLALSAAEQLEVASDDPPRCLHCRRLLVL